MIAGEARVGNICLTTRRSNDKEPRDSDHRRSNYRSKRQKPRTSILTIRRGGGWGRTRWRIRIECGSSPRPQRLRRALGAGQIVNDRGGVLRRYRSLVDVDHLIHDLLPNVPRQRGLIQRVIGRMTGEAVTVHRIRSRAVRKRRLARWELQIGRYQLVELLGVTGERQEDGAQNCRGRKQGGGHRGGLSL